MSQEPKNSKNTVNAGSQIIWETIAERCIQEAMENGDSRTLSDKGNSHTGSVGPQNEEWWVKQLAKRAGIEGLFPKPRQSARSDRSSVRQGANLLNDRALRLLWR